METPDGDTRWRHPMETWSEKLVKGGFLCICSRAVAHTPPLAIGDTRWRHGVKNSLKVMFCVYVLVTYTNLTI